MNQPLVSIITVSYNSEKFIEQSIKSVLCQSYENFEYIISDDCSNDNTWKIIEKFVTEDNRITAFQNKENLGEYRNRNKAIIQSKGDYIVFVDGDDVTLNRGIELAIAEMEKRKDCGFGIVKSENPKFIGPLVIGSKDGYNLEFFGGGFLNSSLANNIFRTKVLKQNLFDESYSNADTFCRLNLLKKNNVLVLINPISLWRISSTQASKKISYYNYIQQQISFIKQDIFDDKDFTFFNVEKLKPLYYKLIFKSIKLNLLKLDFKKIYSLRKFYVDSLFTSFRYSLKNIDTHFWNEYNYENLNVKLD